MTIKELWEKIDRAILIEAFTGSFVIAFGGLITIPLAGWINGVPISMSQGAGMGAIFFFTRPLGLYAVRYCFKRWGKS
jgi:hypothetical protein